MTRPEQTYGRARDRARVARTELIGLTHDLPKEVPQEILRLWNEADTALLTFIRAIDAADLWE